MTPKRSARGLAHPLSPTSSTGSNDLGPELLNAIFSKLSPSPIYLAALHCVCKDWRDVMQEHTYQQLCLEAAPRLCEAMGYSKISAPPGGWAAVFQLLVYCPGLPSLLYTTARGEWWNQLGHVQKKTGGFLTGNGVASALQLKEAFHKDELFVTGLCQHEGARKNVWDEDVEYISANNYCSSEYEVADEEEEEDSDWEEPDEDGSAVRGYVCGNGHLTLGAVGNFTELGGTKVAGSGEGLTVEPSPLLKGLSETFALQEEFENELEFRKGLDAFSVARKLRSLARGMRDGVVAGDQGELEQGEEALFSTESKTMVEMEAVLPEFQKRPWDTVVAFEEDFEDSESESEPDAKAGGKPPLGDSN
ncbi:F-box family protein [Klebsormidium nitens]|uniref:F-box family protein n=1 Tax=Klebsormidium nitens TaxID=105231 RepID=A0A1Y1HKS0_KLENI|nr:F-box family protein [Klebsormidium nitens]|eukprot:GAQ79200.1 F-box family protein [Klebsormidium nitens]